MYTNFKIVEDIKNLRFTHTHTHTHTHTTHTHTHTHTHKLTLLPSR